MTKFILSSQRRWMEPGQKGPGSAAEQLWQLENGDQQRNLLSGTRL